VCVVSVTFVWAFVHRPFRPLISGTHRVAKGDLEFRIPITGTDEIGELAAAFNSMTAQLGVARSTLEQDVESKTRELRRAGQVLAGSEKYAAIGKLAATVAHEVNNPLFGILTYSRLGLKELDKPGLDDAARRRMREQLAVIERESRRCGEIMKNLLTFARQAPRRCEPARVNELIERSLLLIRHQAELSGITVHTNLDSALPEVRCDAGQIQQVVLVLLANACEAMSKGGVLHVTTSAAATQIVIAVRDNGPGIPPEVLPHIFEPFYSTKDDAHRTGLGLAVAQSIVEQHSGSIGARTLDTGGAEFTVLLPVTPPAEPSAPALTLTETHP
jgi:two-component system NtrC family sensor kinase